MLDMVYRQAATEVLDILKHTKKEDVDLIPQKFINFLRNNALEDYIPNFDHSKKLEDMNLRQETRGILGLIYRHYWCSEEERNMYREILKEKEIVHQRELKEKFKMEDLFKKQVEEVIQENKNLKPIESKKKTIFTRIWEKIKYICSIKI